MTTFDEGMAALERLRNPTPRDKVQNYLCHAIHKFQCGTEPTHGPYKHEDEAGYYADVVVKLALEMPDEQAPAATMSRDEELEWWQAEAAHWRAMAVKAREALHRLEQTAMYEQSNAATLAPEPPVGSTLFHLDPHRQQWTRRDDGWHCSDPDCVSCPLDWSLIVEIGDADEMRRELPSGRVSR